MGFGGWEPVDQTIVRHMRRECNLLKLKNESIISTSAFIAYSYIILNYTVMFTVIC